MLRLKRKSLSQINISSDGFSLHGPHRNLGYIGQSLAFHPDLCANQNDTGVLKNVSVNNAGKTTETKLIRTTVIVNKKTAQETLLNSFISFFSNMFEKTPSL